MHEIFGGNISALRAVISYTKILDRFEYKYSELKMLFKNKESPLINPNLHIDQFKVNWENYKYLNKPHTPESIYKETEFSFYNMWKNLVLGGLGKEAVKILTTQVDEYTEL